MSKQYLFVGLGNPGKKYEMTRHNIGFLVIQTFAQQFGFTLVPDSKFKGVVAKKKFHLGEIHLLLPTTFMNESGQAVKRYVDFYKIPLSAMTVVVDDADLSFGAIRLRSQGSAGGHNGLKSLISHLGTTQFVRLRMGIGRPAPKSSLDDLADYVLDNFSQDEMPHLVPFLQQGTSVLERLLTQDVATAMNFVNKNS
ncbi:aminoacyl-tRNA hydrolase [Parachlamydia sp. AcF125]|uniref:aminoacyl-tRNA hydrolase n=1 Tax=Parachlamydia sp. AcF125 TaxID=2795736 RepID=UPI0032D5AABC